jgi:hypothetical protein
MYRLNTNPDGRSSQGEIGMARASVWVQIQTGYIGRFKKTVKLQNSCTKLPINLNCQYSMTQTFATRVVPHYGHTGELGMRPLDAPVNGFFVCDFEFGSLGFVWDLVFGAWNFLVFRYSAVRFLSKPYQRRRWPRAFSLISCPNIVQGGLCRMPLWPPRQRKGSRRCR